MGGTNLRVGLREVGGTRLLGVESVPARGEWSPGSLADEVESLLERLVHGHPGSRVVALGAGITGDIDFRTGTCYSMKRFPGLEEAPLGALLSRRLGVPVRLLNDGLTAALAELRLGAGRSVSDFVMVTLGTGIGGGIVVGGRLLTGERGRTGKVGHHVIDLDGPVHCHCGLPGCWQSLAGKDGIAARAPRWASCHPGSALANLMAEGRVDLQQVTALGGEGDAASVGLLEETGRYVGIGLANLVKILAPERVLVGGGIAEGNAVLLEAIRRTVAEYAIKPYQAVPVLPAALGKEGGVVGATLLPEEAFTPLV
jgi:glucokinase